MLQHREPGWGRGSGRGGDSEGIFQQDRAAFAGRESGPDDRGLWEVALHNRVVVNWAQQARQPWTSAPRVKRLSITFSEQLGDEICVVAMSEVYRNLGETSGGITSIKPPRTPPPPEPSWRRKQSP